MQNTNQNNIKLEKIPNHIAFIPDGNRRWAKKQGKPANYGHKYGAENVKNLCNWCLKYGIKFLTLYCLSCENIKNRSKIELQFLAQYIKVFLSQKEIENYHKDNVNIDIIGDETLLSKGVQKVIQNVRNNQLKNSKLNLNLCIGYDGRYEILQAVKNISNDVKNNKLKVEKIDNKTFEKYIFSENIPDVDFLIRTSGEQRISGFLLWKLSYSEFYFCNAYFPEFNENDFLLALYNFQNRIRRYGK